MSGIDEIPLGRDGVCFIQSTNHMSVTNMNAQRLFHLAKLRTFRCVTTATLLGSLSILGACQTQQQRVSEREDNLAAAGFLIRPANTPKRKAMLSKLPPNRFVRRVKGEDVRYVYADPLVCGCLYVGSQQAYGQYRQHEQQQHLADEQQMTALNYSDAPWNWGAWGPWEPGYGFGAGFGW